MLDTLFSNQFLIYALILSGIIGFSISLLSTFLVINRMSNYADTLGHTAILSVATYFMLVTLLGTIVISLDAFIILFNILLTILIHTIITKRKNDQDLVLPFITFIFLGLSGIFLTFATGTKFNLESYIWGSIFGITIENIVVMLVLTLMLLIFLKVYWRKIVKTIYFPEQAKIEGINTNLISLVLLMFTSVFIGLSIKIIGILLVGGFIAIPSFLQIRNSKSLKNFIVRTVLNGTIGGLLGIVIISIYTKLNPGGAIIMSLVFVGIIINWFESGKKE
jgi:zinc transport system permease protein